MSDDQANFVAAVLKRLPRYRYRRKSDKESILSCINECYTDGFTETDAVRYTKHLEHYNPEIKEEPALAVMNAISRKYRRAKAVAESVSTDIANHEGDAVVVSKVVRVRKV